MSTITQTLLKPMLKPISLVYVMIIIAACGLLKPALELSSEAGMLPRAMLMLLIVFSGLSLIVQIKKSWQENSKDDTVLKSPKRVFSALLAVLLLVVSIQWVGFYPTIIVFVPALSYFFGCRSRKVLAASTVIFVALIYLVFSVAMSKQFPAGWLF
ncbi:tripartite tricarboxylate transporter TctB family protein [Vibrio mytili]|uniref:DUF1468 domain-containing protein n=1 Tax=Vibrio mytili TaxID=50718 RepID=A0A0C3HM28_9VIBR|nr:tripartite tricarboxylate transporter TctB family protein [Vibrio mytili]KIN09176.1 hypothetical protein SU60_20950 [Vibrio mytili]